MMITLILQVYNFAYIFFYFFETLKLCDKKIIKKYKFGYIFNKINKKMKHAIKVTITITMTMTMAMIMDTRAMTMMKHAQ